MPRPNFHIRDHCCRHRDPGGSSAACHRSPKHFQQQKAACLVACRDSVSPIHSAIPSVSSRPLCCMFHGADAQATSRAVLYVAKAARHTWGVRRYSCQHFGHLLSHAYHVNGSPSQLLVSQRQLTEGAKWECWNGRSTFISFQLVAKSCESEAVPLQHLRP